MAVKLALRAGLPGGFLVRKAIVRLEGLDKLKNPKTPLEIKPTIFRFVA
jgi:hypothetical protein